MDVVSPLNIIVGEHHFIIHHQICPFTGQLLRFPRDLFPCQTLTQLRFLTTAHSTNQGGHLVSVAEGEVIDAYSFMYLQWSIQVAYFRDHDKHIFCPGN